MSFKDEMEDRLINFALVGIEISENLPQSYIGEHLGKQLARSSTSPALTMQKLVMQNQEKTSYINSKSQIKNYGKHWFA